jgi:hypothetical protein
MLHALGLDSTSADRIRRVTQPHFAPLMQHDSEFDLKSISLEEWLSNVTNKDAAAIPWKIEVKDPELRIHVTACRGRATGERLFHRAVNLPLMWCHYEIPATLPANIL